MMKPDNNQLPEEHLAERVEHDPYDTRATLIERVRNQYDDASWSDFVKIYRGYAYAIIRNMNISAEDAEDLTQQLLLKVWKKLPQTEVEQIRRFRSWFSVVTKNLVTDFIRKRCSDAERMEKVEREENLSYCKAIRLPEFEAIFEREWKLHIAHLALDNIEPLFSKNAIEVFRLSLKGLETKSISERLNLKEDSVYRLKSLVKERLMLEIELLREDLG